MPDTTSPQRLYEADAVDAYIGELRAQIEDLQIRLREREAAAPAPETETLVAQAVARGAAIVGEARREAEEVLRASRREADELIDSASRRAETIRQEAEEGAAVSRSVAEGEAAAIVEHSRREADRIVDEATKQANATRAEAEAAAESRISSGAPNRSTESDRLIIEQIEASHRRLLEMFSAIVESVRAPVAAATEPAPFAPAPLLDLPRWDPRPRAADLADPPDGEAHSTEPPAASSPISEPVTTEPAAPPNGDRKDADVDLTALDADDRRFFEELRASLRAAVTPAPHLGHRPDRESDDLGFAERDAVRAGSPTEEADLSTLPPPDPSALVEPYEDDEPGRIGVSRWARRSRA